MLGLCLVLTFLGVTSMHVGAVPLAATGLSAQYSVPASSFPLDNPTPPLHWLAQSTDRNQSQTAYQIIVSLTPDVAQCISTSSCIWNTNQVYSSSNEVVYAGNTLNDDTTYYWIVRWWDAAGVQAPDSDVATFSIAILNSGLWSPSIWIGALDVNIMRSPFTVPAGLIQARAYVSALGWGQFYLNGELMDTGALGVGWTRYDKRALYLMYDVTEYLTTGTNVAGVMLGHGWKDDRSFPNNDGDAADHVPVLRFQMIGTFANGTKVPLLSSSSSWVGTMGPIIDSSVYNGETYDARLEQDGWSTATFANASSWAAVPEYPNFSPILSVQALPLIQVMREVSPVSVSQPQPGIFVVDFGENLSGYCRISAFGASGTTLTMQHAEVLMHPPYGERNGLLYFGNLRSALATDTYTLRGSGAPEVYTPRFTYHGFRYVQITGYPGELTAGNITMLHVRTNNLFRSNLTTSSIILNQIQYNAVTSQGSNLMSVPTDCDQRDERLGWMGDAGLSADSMTLNYMVEALHLNFIRNIDDEIAASTYSIPDVVPFVRYGGRPADPSWSAAFTNIIFSQFKYLNNLNLPQAQFQNLLNYLQNLAAQVAAAGGLANWPTPYGDWVPPNNNLKVSGPFTSSYNYLVTINQVYEIALALGYEAEAAQLQTLYVNVANEFNSAFITNGNYANAQQIAMALPLLLDIVPESLNSTALFEKLINDIVVVNNMHVTTGIIGFKGLFPAVSQNGRMDIALALAEQVDYPSLGYMAFNDLEPANGNLWELFDSNVMTPGMDSRNHHMFSSPSAWHFELAGFSKLRTEGLAPVLYLTAATTPGLSAANVSIISANGLVGFDWVRQGGSQCGKAPENQDSNPYLPLHDELTLSCGSSGGVITAITFASWGLPTGYCGSFDINTTCHLTNSSAVVESLCVGKSSCEIPTTDTFWGQDPCYGLVKRMFVQAECSLVDVIDAAVVVPVGSTAQVLLPPYGVTSPVVRESGVIIFSNGNFHPGVAGVLSGAESEEGVTVVLGSGSYALTLSSA